MNVTTAENRQKRRRLVQKCAAWECTHALDRLACHFLSVGHQGIWGDGGDLVEG